MANRILIIDADRVLARDVSGILQARGVETRLCTDGQAGLEEARSWQPDLVVLCVELPNLSGYSVCNKLKKDEQLRSIPLILTSAEATTETFEQHRKLRTRADEYVLKPFAPGALVQTIARMIELPPEPTTPGPLDGLGHDDLERIDRVFDEFAAGGTSDGGAPPGTADIPPATVVPRGGERGASVLPRDGGDESLRTRIAELEAELAHVRDELRDANAERLRLSAMERSMQEAIETSRAATERASAAENRLEGVELRLRHADALRDKARRALSVVLQALEEPAQRPNPGEPLPRRE